MARTPVNFMSLLLYIRRGIIGKILKSCLIGRLAYYAGAYNKQMCDLMLTIWASPVVSFEKGDRNNLYRPFFSLPFIRLSIDSIDVV
jgi:hypothetical protein